MRTHKFGWLAAGAALLLALSALPSFPTAAQGSGRTFPETGKTVSGKFLTYWDTHGGLAQQGFPISAEMQEKSAVDGKTYTVQYFERAVFEAHPENQPPFDVLLSLLGNFVYKANYPNGAPNQTVSTSNATKFTQTGHSLGGKFRTYWETHGGLAQQGYPISDEFTEISDLNGKPYTVQYFERAVFELHPENAGTPYEVLLSQLGTFQLRDNQSTAVATDTVYSAGNCGYGGLVKTIQAVDDATVKFTLCAPDPAFPSKIAFSSNGIQSAKHLKDTGGKPLENPVGTGAYMVKEWVRGDHITLVPNPNYWGPAPALKTVVVKWNTQATARLNSLKSGEADGIDNPDPHDFATIQNDPTLKLYPRDALNVFYVGMNNTKGPLANEKVRQAVAMGLNRGSMVDKYYPPGSTVADYFTPCAIPGGCEGDKWYSYDLTAAKALMASAGFPNGFNIKLSFRNVVRGYLPAPDKVAQEVQSQLKALNITATIDQQESGTFLDNAAKGNLEMFLLGWGADYPDQTDFLDAHFGTGANDSFGTKFPDITKVLAQAASIADQTARNKLYAQANNLIKQHVPMVPVAHGGSASAYKAAVQGAFSSPLGNEEFRVMSEPGRDTFVWVQNAEPLSLYCSDETDGESLRICEQIFDPLLTYKIGGTDVVTGLATSFTPNTALNKWTVKLRPGVKFSDGTPLTAKDVVATYAVQWDAKNPLHVGNTGNFNYWTILFTAFLNAPPPKP
jgi:peptide/nickel transport system substrate-binding protein